MKIAEIIEDFGIICICLALAGCSGSCLRIGGSYNGIDGSIEYCFSQEKSDAVGVPVLEGDKEDSYVITDDQVEKILDLVGLSCSGLGVIASGNNAKKLFDLLKKE
jgi:hypothetical protein